MHGALRSSNGLLMMAAMLLVILHGGKGQLGKIPAIQIEFDDALPEPGWKALPGRGVFKLGGECSNRCGSLCWFLVYGQ
jgi:hypothetical protein